MASKRKSKSGRVLPDGVSERADGRFLYRYVVLGKTHYIYDRDLNSLKKKILEAKVKVAEGVVCDISKLTLKEWYPQYLEIYKKGKIKESSLVNMRNYYKWYLEGSAIDRIELKNLKRTMIIAHFQKLATEKNLAEGTLRSLASMLYNCLQQGVYDEVLRMNPAKDIMKDVSAKPKQERFALEAEEVRVMIDFLKLEGTWQNVHLPAVAIGLSTGLRSGELYGLTWNDVDFENMVIHVNHTLNYRDRGSGKGHEFFITEPKTKSSVRDFPMTEEVKALFEKQLKYQKDMRIRQDINIDGYKGFVFTTKTGFPFTHESVTRTLQRIIVRANEWETERAEKENRKAVVIREHTPHHWRHTFTSNLVNKIPPERAKYLLGHSKIKTTIDIYAHFNKTSERETREDLNGIIKVL